MNSFACSYQLLTKSRDSAVFVHLNKQFFFNFDHNGKLKHLEQYTAVFFGFGGCNYCNTCQQGELWATLSDACLEALEETVPLAWLF